MKPLLSRFGMWLILLAGPATVMACNQGAEGDRCNPARVADFGSDECGDGLSCQQPVNCPENYCCPKTGSSSNPNCQTGCNGGDLAICAADEAAGVAPPAGLICPSSTSAAASSTPTKDAGKDSGKDAH